LTFFNEYGIILAYGERGIRHLKQHTKT